MSINPPRQRLPPLNALRAFEAAARLGGISKAADELCVTPVAIAQHVKALEDWAGAKLFSRQAKGVVLNDLGQRCLSDFETAF
ncbi:MAG: DNA-binding transcriptional LysR family regulator, partial [Paracoccaceae bacterium]